MGTYHQPTTLDHALLLLGRQSGLKILAGGTDVLPAKATRAGWGQMQHPDVLDISRIEFHRGVTAHEDVWTLSPLTTWTDVIRADLPPLFDGLKAAAREVGGVQIQNRGTVIGNICNASPAADGVPALLAMDALVDIQSHAGMRRMPLAEFIDGYRHTVLAPDELVVGLRIPKRLGHGYFLKLGARRYLVISIAMVAGTFEINRDGRIDAARIAVGACSAVAQRLPHLEAALVGRIADPALVRPEYLEQLQPIDDVRASGAYRRAAALQLVRDLVDMVARQSRSAA
jgi:xanthine dehydrogenase small subunit